MAIVYIFYVELILLPLLLFTVIVQQHYKFNDLRLQITRLEERLARRDAAAKGDGAK